MYVMTALKFTARSESLRRINLHSRSHIKLGAARLIHLMPRHLSQAMQ